MESWKQRGRGGSSVIWFVVDGISQSISACCATKEKGLSLAILASEIKMRLSIASQTLLS